MSTSSRTTGFADYDAPAVAESLLRPTDGGAQRRVDLMLGGVRCGGCVARIERDLANLGGVSRVDANFATVRASVTFDPRTLPLSALLSRVDALGYSAQPYDADLQESRLKTEHRVQLRRLLVSGLLGMQVMMLSVALYAGEWSGISAEMRTLLEVVCLLLTLPLLGYGAAPFFAAAWRDVTHGRVGMDVPVSLGLCVAFAGSLHGMARGGPVYFDSVAMFTCLLLLARFLESRARARNLRALEKAAAAPPALARRVNVDGSVSSVAAAQLAVGEVVRVPEGEAVPADGVVIRGASTFDESLLTGESTPCAREPGSEVLAGALNQRSPVDVRVTGAGSATVFAQVLALAERAREHKPALARLADRVAGWFVLAILVLAACVAVVYALTDPARWIPVTIAVLVVTCPCALSLATPLALTAGLGALARRGVVATSGDAVERLAGTTHVLFDKTGTLTEGRPELVAVDATSTFAWGAPEVSGSAAPTVPVPQGAGVPAEVAATTNRSSPAPSNPAAARKSALPIAATEVALQKLAKSVSTPGSDKPAHRGLRSAIPREGPRGQAGHAASRQAARGDAPRTPVPPADTGAAQRRLLTPTKDPSRAARIGEGDTERTGEYADRGSDFSHDVTRSAAVCGEALRIAAALEAHSAHPLAQAFTAAAAARRLETPTAHNVEYLAGRGLTGEVGGIAYYLGAPCGSHARARENPCDRAATLGADRSSNGALTRVVLMHETNIIAEFTFADALRADAARTVEALRRAELGVSLCSGDGDSATRSVAKRLGIDTASGELLPQDKLDTLTGLQASGERVLAVGDGVNDTPVLAAANASAAMGRGADSAKTRADLLLLGNRLGAVSETIDSTRRTRRIIRQNLTWALTYNALAVPAAVAGLVPPWLAALGMSASSIAVVLNSARAGK